MRVPQVRARVYMQRRADVIKAQCVWFCGLLFVMNKTGPACQHQHRLRWYARLRARQQVGLLAVPDLSLIHPNHTITTSHSDLTAGRRHYGNNCVKVRTSKFYLVSRRHGPAGAKPVSIPNDVDEHPHKSITTHAHAHTHTHTERERARARERESISMIRKGRGIV